VTRTPLENARNLGPTSASELAAAGIHSLEQLREIGWEDALLRLVRACPNRLNLTWPARSSAPSTTWTGGAFRRARSTPLVR
jgi:hypothetical protein